MVGGWQGTVNSSASVNRQRESRPPPLSFSRSTLLLPPSSLSFSAMWKSNATDATEWKMKRYHGLQSASSALPESFHLLPQQVQQKTRSKNQETKAPRDQAGLISQSRWTFFFFFPFVLPTKWSLGLLTKPHYSLHISKNQLYKSSSKEQLSIRTSMQWSTSSDCSSY